MMGDGAIGHWSLTIFIYERAEIKNAGEKRFYQMAFNYYAPMSVGERTKTTGDLDS